MPPTLQRIAAGLLLLAALGLLAMWGLILFGGDAGPVSAADDAVDLLFHSPVAWVLWWLALQPLVLAGVALAVWPRGASRARLALGAVASMLLGVLSLLRPTSFHADALPTLVAAVLLVVQWERTRPAPRV